MIQWAPWEILAEMTDQQEDIVVVLAVVGEDLVDSQEEDHLLEAEIVEATGQCLKLCAATVEKSVRCLLDQLTANRFIAATVLRKWEAGDQIREGRKGPILEHQVLIKVKASSMP